MIQSARADCERIWVLMKAVFRRNTLCISRNNDEIRAQIIRRTPMAGGFRVYGFYTGSSMNFLVTRKISKSCLSRFALTASMSRPV